MFANVTAAQFAPIATAHKIAGCHRRCFLTLANYGKITSKEFGSRLTSRPNYRKACRDLMLMMSEGRE